MLTILKKYIIFLLFLCFLMGCKKQNDGMTVDIITNSKWKVINSLYGDTKVKYISFYGNTYEFQDANRNILEYGAYYYDNYYYNKSKQTIMFRRESTPFFGVPSLPYSDAYSLNVSNGPYIALNGYAPVGSGGKIWIGWLLLRIP